MLLLLPFSIMPLVLAAMAYFVPVLTRSDGAPRSVEALAFPSIVPALCVASMSGSISLSNHLELKAWQTRGVHLRSLELRFAEVTLSQCEA